MEKNPASLGPSSSGISQESKGNPRHVGLENCAPAWGLINFFIPLLIPTSSSSQLNWQPDPLQGTEGNLHENQTLDDFPTF